MRKEVEIMSDYFKQKLFGVLLIVIGGVGLLIDLSITIAFTTLGLYVTFTRKDIFDNKDWD